MKIYCASLYTNRLIMANWHELLIAEGHEPTSRWATDAGMEHLDRVVAARMDLEDIDRADIVLSLTLERGQYFMGGGRHVELGYALAKGKRLMCVGGKENVFHHLPEIEWFTSVQQAIKAIPL